MTLKILTDSERPEKYSNFGILHPVLLAFFFLKTSGLCYKQNSIAKSVVIFGQWL